MDYHEDDEALLSSQVVEEEDLLFDESHPEQELKLEVNSNGSNESKFAQRLESDETLRVRLAGPSTNKASEYAGMQMVDKDKVNEIIYDVSKGSSFFENERKKDAAVTERINAMLEKYEKVKNDDLSAEFAAVERLIQTLEDERDLSQYICHVDMDAFYASVEELDQPQLKNVPMAVGGIGMLCTSNYEARKYGVRSAMPGYIALKLCPQLKIIPLNFAKYRQASSKVRSIFEQYDPHFCPMSLDEAYLNITNYLKTTSESPAQVVQEIRDRIFKETGLTASAGIAANKMLAKICTDVQKPNGQFQLENDIGKITDFVNPLPIRKIPGVGRVTERVLNALNVNTCQDIFPQRAMLYRLLSDISFKFLLRAHLGIGSTAVDTDYVRKSMSVERTFRSLSSRTDLFFKLKDISIKLAKDLEIRTRAKTLPGNIYKQEDLEKHAAQLLEKELPVSLRLMGIRLSSLSSRDEDEKKGVKRFFHPVSESASSSPHDEHPSKHVKTEHVAPENEREPNGGVDLNSALCPICNKKIPDLDNRSLNEHIDSCLNMSLVNDELRQSGQSVTTMPESAVATRSRTKKDDNRYFISSSKSLRDYFASSNTSHTP